MTDYVDYEDAFNIGSIQLEPRLQEYIKRKKFNEENNIEPPITEEKEFCITPYDLKMIKRHKQGKKKLYTSKRLIQNPNYIKPDSGGFGEMDVDFKNDPRYQRLQRKMQSHKTAQKKIRNFEGISEDYTIFHQTNPYDLNPAKRPTKIAKPYENSSEENSNSNDDSTDDDYERVGYGSYDYKGVGGCTTFQDDSIMMDSRDLVLGPSRPIRNDRKQRGGNSDVNPNRGRYCYSPNNRSNNFTTYNHPPKIEYKQLVSKDGMSNMCGMEHSRDLNDIIGNMDTYNKHLDKTYEYIDGQFDIDTRTCTPGCRKGTQRETPSSYQSIPFSYGNGLPDISVEESLKGGIRESSKKSLGFRNPFENQFDYISPDISDYRHTVQMWPQPTRGRDVEVARPHSASARQDREMRDKILDRKKSMHEDRKKSIPEDRKKSIRKPTERR